MGQMIKCGTMINGYPVKIINSIGILRLYTRFDASIHFLVGFIAHDSYFSKSKNHNLMLQLGW